MSTIRVQALPKFPASVEAGDGILVERHNGVFTFSVDIAALLSVLGDPVEVAHGGTGVATLTKHAVLVGSGADAIAPLAVGAAKSVLQGATGADPAFTAAPTVEMLTVNDKLGVVNGTYAGAPLSPYQVLMNNGGQIGSLLSMQKGIGIPGGLWAPGNNTSGIAVFLQTLIDAGTNSSGNGGGAGLGIDAEMQAGTNGTVYNYIHAKANGTWTNPGGLGGATGLEVQGWANTGDGFGLAGYAINTGHTRQLVSAEFDTRAEFATDAKKGIQIVDISGSAFDGANSDSSAALHILKSDNTAVGWKAGIMFGTSAGGNAVFPVAAGNTVIVMRGGNVAAALDISTAMTFSSGNWVLTPNNTGWTSYNAAGLAFKQVLKLNASDKLSFYDGVALLSAAGNLQLGASGTLGNVTLGNAASGTVTVQPVTGALGTATLSLPAATDTLIGKATTDTLTNKTYDTAGTGNLFRINGTAITDKTGTGKAVLDTAPTLTSTGTGGGAVVVSGLAIAMLNVTGGSGSGQGAQLAMTRGAVQHNFGHAAAILGGTSDDFVIYGSGANNIKLFTNGILGLTIDTAGKANFKASATSAAPINIPAGTAPTSPVDGDVWYDGTNLKFRVSGTTKTVTLT